MGLHDVDVTLTDAVLCAAVVSEWFAFHAFSAAEALVASSASYTGVGDDAVSALASVSPERGATTGLAAAAAALALTRGIRAEVAAHAPTDPQYTKGCVVGPSYKVEIAGSVAAAAVLGCSAAALHPWFEDVVAPLAPAAVAAGAADGGPSFAVRATVGGNVFALLALVAVATYRNRFRDYLLFWAIGSVAAAGLEACGVLTSAWGQLLSRLAFAWLLMPRAQTQPWLARRWKGDRSGYKRCDWAAETADCPRTGKTYLVVGTGFLGGVLVERLLERGETDVTCFDLGAEPLPHIRELQERHPSLVYIRGDVTKKEDIAKACLGVDTVFTTFAVIRFWERLSFQVGRSYSVNVEGSRNVAEACRAAGVRRLVFTSTSHVAATTKVEEGVNETWPYVTRATGVNHYGWTKAAGEKAVLDASEAGPGGLKTVSIRPCSGIFGYGDRSMIDRIVEEKSYVCTHPAARIDWVYVDNVVLGLLKAEARLREGAAGVAGEAFGVSNGLPVSYSEMFDCFQSNLDEAERADYTAPRAPRGFLKLLGLFLEGVTLVSGGYVAWRCLAGTGLEVLTGATEKTTCMRFSYDDSKARRVLKYKPVYSLEEAMQRCVAEMKDSAKGKRMRKFEA